MVGHIVVGVDGSVHANHALRWAASLGRALGAEVTAVHAVGLLEAQEERLGDASAAASATPSWWRPTEAPDVARLLVLDGDPVSVVLRSAEELGADLIVVGSRGMGDRPELLLGSTSTQVAQRAAVPVVVVPPRDEGL